MDYTTSFKVLTFLTLVYISAGRQILITANGQAFCGLNEVMVESSPCRESCRSNVTNAVEKCNDEKLVGCYCDSSEGYVRHPTTKACVKTAFCPAADDFDYNSMEFGKLTIFSGRIILLM